LEPKSVAQSFTTDAITVRDFLSTAESTSAEGMLTLQHHLLGSLRDPSIIGTYAGYHTNSIYKNGYTHPLTTVLAHKYVFPSLPMH
jgi:hypothetical protein